MVFNERSGGIAPERRITLEVGVHPDRFDTLVEQLRQVGHLASVSVHHRDRTGEFRQLHARRESLKKHLEAVVKLRGGKNLSVDEELKLEQKIQDVERELQTLAVQFGDLLGKESYYHVYLTVSEYPPGGRLDPTFTLPRRVAHAFVWALAWWCAGAVAVAVLAGAYVSVRALVMSR